MRGVLLWLLATSVAFLATAGAFLFLANLGAGPGRSGPIPRAPEARGPALALRFDEVRLAELEGGPNQALTLYVDNRGDTALPEVRLTLDVTSEASLEASTRRYEESVEDLAPGQRRAITVEADLSAPAGNPELGEGPEGDARQILEARATAPGGVSAVETAVLAP